MARLARIVISGIAHHVIAAIPYVALNPVRARLTCLRTFIQP
jgi:hypothetical protein